MQTMEHRDGGAADLTIQLSTASLIGGREQNEDSLAVHRDTRRGRTTAVVCDGLGGHVAGKTASSAAAEAFMAHCRDHAEAPPAFRLRDALQAANAAVRRAIIDDRRLTGMGTTLVAVEADDIPDAGAGTAADGPAPGGTAHWISVGDSPLWSCQDGEVCGMVNTMHNVPGSSNRLTSAVMGQNEIEDIDQGSIEFPAGDTLILASDGIDALKNGRLLRLTHERHVLELARTLAGEAVAAGGPKADNTTVVAIRRATPGNPAAGREPAARN